MSDTGDFGEADDPRFHGLAEAIDRIVEAVCQEHYDALTQEHQLTSRIAQAIDGLRNSHEGLMIEVTVQELPDKGKDSLERKVGADVYISIVRRDDPKLPISKGILAQSKWDDSPTGDLRRQEGDMLDKSGESYVMIYGPEGIVVVRAQRDRRRGRLDADGAQTVGELVESAVQCHAGDPKLGRDLSKPRRQAIRDMLMELAVPMGVSVDVVRGDRRHA